MAPARTSPAILSSAAIKEAVGCYGDGYCQNTASFIDALDRPAYTPGQLLAAVRMHVVYTRDEVRRDVAGHAAQAIRSLCDNPHDTPYPPFVVHIGPRAWLVDADIANEAVVPVLQLLHTEVTGELYPTAATVLDAMAEGGEKHAELVEEAVNADIFTVYRMQDVPNVVLLDK